MACLASVSAPNPIPHPVSHSLFFSAPSPQILKYPLTTESAMKKIEDNNTLVFIVDARWAPASVPVTR
jgi:hypothetical protein